MLQTFAKAQMENSTFIIPQHLVSQKVPGLFVVLLVIAQLAHSNSMAKLI